MSYILIMCFKAIVNKLKKDEGCLSTILAYIGSDNISNLKRTKKREEELCAFEQSMHLTKCTSKHLSI